LTASNRPKIADVAAAAGVSAPTVSKVLNGRSYVSAATRAKVNQALEELDYSKRSAPAQVPGLLQLVVNNFDNPWLLEIMAGAEAAAARQGFTLACTLAEHATPESWRKLRLASPNQLAGVILLAPHRGSRLVTTLRSLNIPAVAMDPQGNEAIGIPSVSPTAFSGALKAVEHLLDLGHRRIGIITGGGAGSVHSRARYAAYAAALQAHGLEVDQELVRDGDFSIEAGFRLGGELLDLPARPTAIFAGNDLQALGLMSAASKRAVSIPGELSVVGFDDIAQAALTSPPLTTIRQPLEQMAAMAVNLLVEQFGKAQQRPQAVELATELIVRGSTAAPAAA
jgi:DNA-binding LacI/PurR family transcriptional regulator